METLKAAARHASSIAVKLPNGKSCRYVARQSATYQIHLRMQAVQLLLFGSTVQSPTCLLALSIPVSLMCHMFRSYGQLLQGSERVHSELQRLLPSVKGRIDGPRIGIYAEPGLPYVAATWASWMSGGVAVPLAVTHPPHELDYVIRDAGISAVSNIASVELPECGTSVCWLAAGQGS